MGGRRLTEEQKEMRRRLLIRFVMEGYSGNKIVKMLRERGLGMRRQEVYKYIRKIKSVKMLSVYGTFRGKQKRIDIIGTNREIYNAMKHAAVNPPRKNRIVVQARLLIQNPSKYLLPLSEWDRHPDTGYDVKKQRRVLEDFWEEMWEEWE